MVQLVRYDAMCHAIASAYELDEVKEIRDKALALEAYAKQAKNVEAEDRCKEIRYRAERKWADLYRAGEKARNRHTVAVDGNDRYKTLADMNVTKDQSAQWQRLADIPEEEFGAAAKNIRTSALEMSGEVGADCES